LLPDQIQVVRLELPEGDHEIQLRPFDQGGELSSTISKKIHIYDGRNTYLMGTLPKTHFVGELLTSGGEQ
jgi:hypothetical protein